MCPKPVDKLKKEEATFIYISEEKNFIVRVSTHRVVSRAMNCLLATLTMFLFEICAPFLRSL